MKIVTVTPDLEWFFIYLFIFFMHLNLIGIFIEETNIWIWMVG